MCFIDAAKVPKILIMGCFYLSFLVLLSPLMMAVDIEKGNNNQIGILRHNHSHSIHLADMRGRASVTPIPLLSVSLNADAKNYLPRLLLSIDYPVRSIIIQIGNSDESIREGMIQNAVNISQSMPHLNITISTGMNSPCRLSLFFYSYDVLVLQHSIPAILACC